MGRDGEREREGDGKDAVRWPQSSWVEINSQGHWTELNSESGKGEVTKRVVITGDGSLLGCNKPGYQFSPDRPLASSHSLRNCCVSACGSF